MLITILVLAIFAIIFYNIYYKNSEETFNEDIYYKGNIDEKVIAFACNVDWGNEYIPEMLSVFEKEDIKITFLLRENGQRRTKNY